MNIRPLRRKNRFERLVEAARDALPDVHPSKGVKTGLTAVAATTAASAAISALRRRTEGTRSHQ